jgi:hypothetical protein
MEPSTTVSGAAPRSPRRPTGHARRSAAVCGSAVDRPALGNPPPRCDAVRAAGAAPIYAGQPTLPQAGPGRRCGPFRVALTSSGSAPGAGVPAPPLARQSAVACSVDGAGVSRVHLGLVLQPHPAGVGNLRPPRDRSLAQSGSSPVPIWSCGCAQSPAIARSRCGYGSALVAVYVRNTTVIVLATCWPDRSAGAGVSQRDDRGGALLADGEAVRAPVFRGSSSLGTRRPGASGRQQIQGVPTGGAAAGG